MGARVAIFILLIFAVYPGVAGIGGDSGTSLDSYVRLFLKDDNTEAKDAAVLKSFLKSLEKKNTRTQVYFLQHLFSRTHNKFLKEYDRSATFGETITTGKYNCLTGVTLYSILLKELGFNFRILETNYHIFLLIEMHDNRLALFETTDPVHGFSTDQNDIKKRVSLYTGGQLTAAETSRNFYQYETSVYQEVSMRQLRGLLYYNYAVNAYNRHDLPAAINYFAKGLEFYQSSRTDEFFVLISSALDQSGLDALMKNEYRNTLDASVSKYDGNL